MSDLHLDHKQWDPNGQAPRLDAVAPYLVIAGDLGAIESPIFHSFLKNVSHDFDRVIFVPGNHEFYGFEYHLAMNKMKAMESIYPRLKVLLGPYIPFDDHIYKFLYLNNDMYENRKTIYDPYEDNTVLLPLSNGESVRVIGTTLWSQIPNDLEIRNIIGERVKDYHKILYHNKISDSDREVRLFGIDDSNSIHHNDVEWLQNVFWKNIVTELDDRTNKLDKYEKIKSLIVTHHTPLVEECCYPTYLYNSNGVFDRTRWCNWAFSTRLNWLIHELQPTAWIFGHTHYRTVFQYKWNCSVSLSEKNTIFASNPICNKTNNQSYEKIKPEFIRVL